MKTQDKILILGSNGMAGHMVTKYLKQLHYNVKTAARYNADYIVDVEKYEELDTFFNGTNWDYIVNCIGVLGPDANKNPARTVYLNSFLPNYLSRNKAKVIHISTDCVFDGKSYCMYKVTDTPTETNLYGLTKALGELNNYKDITLRVSIIGPEIKETNRSGLLNWVMNEAPDVMEGWTNALWNGITTLQLAKVIEICIEGCVPCGMIQPSSPPISKAELLQLIVNVYDLDKKVKFVKGPKSVNKCLAPSQGWKAPSHLEQLMELRDYYGTERAK